MNSFEIIKRPLITEKSTLLKEQQQQYAFEVDLNANKNQIRGAVESLFKVHVLDVKTLRVRGKYRRVGKSMGKRSNWKKAVVTLKKGEKIEFFEGV
ncbi:MAG: 50S ribosomal protein L23 [bacterium]